MTFEAPPILFAAADFWMSRWLTPMWFVGLGVTLGLLFLAGFLGICYLLSKIPGVFDGLRKSGAAHVVAGLSAIGLTAVYVWFVYGVFKATMATVPMDELTLLGMGGLIFFSICTWAVLYCSSTRFLMEARSLLLEGIGLYLLSTLLIVMVVGWMCTPLVDNPMKALASIPQLFTSGTTSQSFTIPGAVSEEDAPFTKLDIQFDPQTLDTIELNATKNLLIGDAPSVAEFRVPGYRVDRDVEFRWNRRLGAAKSPFPLAPGSNVYVQNQEFGDATLTVRLASVPPVREATTIVLVAVFVALFGLMFLLMQAISPKTSAIALSAAKSELSQPLPVILMLIVAIAILLFVFLPFHTFGEDIKLLKDCGITLILIAATFQAVWSASTSVNEEIEGRTALTLLSKPIHRRSFIIGKMLGIFWIVMFMFLVLGSWELLWVAYKPIYDARESSLEQPLWQQCHFEMMQTIPGLAMAFFQSVVLGAIAVALGTRLPLVANFTICFAIYLLGHLTPTIVASAEGGLPLVEFFSQLISTLVPNLNLFSMEAAIDSDVGVPWTVLASVLVYTALYFILATLLGLLLFEDRDLA
ncbi:MAG: ABC transporter permease [Pirellula sp.]|jgi:ABC-type transport system involved in multi-copper enzyme maturation permease subunit|nr:ABC transporter permease [Pirellula sp.]